MDNKAFIVSYRPGLGGDYFAQLFSKYDNHYHVGFNRNQLNRYIITHPLVGSGFDSFKNILRGQEQLARRVSVDINRALKEKFNRKHIIINTHYDGAVDSFASIENNVPILLSCDHYERFFYFALAFLKLYLYDSGTGYGLLKLRDRMESEYSLKYENRDYPLELINFLWERSWLDYQYDPKYYKLNVTMLYRDHTVAIEEWYDIFEINHCGNKDNDLEDINFKFRRDIGLIEDTFKISVRDLLDPSLGRPAVKRLEDVVVDKLYKYYESKK